MEAQPIKCKKGGYCQSKGNSSLTCKKCNKPQYIKCKNKIKCTEKQNQAQQV